MARPEAKSLRNPEQVRSFPNGRIELVSHKETTIGRFLLEPGWRWSRDVGPIMGTRSCQIHHLGVVLRGCLRIESDTGEVCEFGVDDAYDIPPGHDATVISDEPFWLSNLQARESSLCLRMAIGCSPRCYARILWTQPRT
jgi:hypothetical protein